MVVALYNGDASVFDKLPSQYFVDVVDDARIHVIALIDPKANGQRLFAFAETYTWNDVLAIVRKHNPDKTFLEDRDGLGEDLSKVPNEFAEELLRKHYGKPSKAMIARDQRRKLTMSPVGASRQRLDQSRR